MAGRCQCQRPCNCCTATSPSVQVVGSGSAGSCFTPSVRYSADAGNLAHAGTDGAVFAAVCLTDPAGDAIAPGEDGCLQVPPPVLHTYGGGEVIPPNDDGSIDLPTSGPPADFADGLTTNLDGDLIADVEAWPGEDLLGNPFAGLAADSTGVYVDAAGHLHGAAEHTQLSDTRSSVVVPATVIDLTAATYHSPPSTPVSITNNSQRIVVATLDVVAFVEVSRTAANHWAMVIEHRLNGGGWVAVSDTYTNTAIGQDRRDFHPRLVCNLGTVVNPGDTLTVEWRVSMSDADEVSHLTYARIDALVQGRTV